MVQVNCLRAEVSGALQLISLVRKRITISSNAVLGLTLLLLPTCPLYGTLTGNTALMY